MANAKWSAQAAITDPISTDEMLVIDDPSGSPSSKRTTLANLGKGITTLPNVVDLTASGDVEVAGNIINDVINTNGFDLQDPDSMGDISWDNATRTFSIAVKSGESEFFFWCDGKKITKTTTQSVVVPDATGTYYVYFDNSGVLQYILESSITDAAFYENSIVGLVYWNATANTGMAGEERHGFRMSGATHKYNHDTLGARYQGGVDPEGFANGSGTYTQTTSGNFWDEDIQHAISTETTHRFLYRLGASGEWTQITADNKVGYKDGADTYYSWNEWDGSTWKLTEGTSSTDYWITFFIATPNLTGGSVMKVMGQNAYSSRRNARNAIEGEVQTLKTNGLPSPEFVFLYAVIVKRDGTLVELADGSLYYDLRTYKGGGSGADTNTTYASDVPTDVTNFDGILSSTDTDVQVALDTIDDLNPMDAQGDVIYGGASGVMTKLAKGTASQVLTMNAGATAPEWASASGGGGTLDDAYDSGGAGAGRTITVDSGAVTLSGGTALLDLTSTATTETVMKITADSLTTGKGLYVYSDSASTSSRRLVSIVNDNAAADETTALYIQQDGNKYGLQIFGNGCTTRDLVVISTNVTTAKVLKVSTSNGSESSGGLATFSYSSGNVWTAKTGESFLVEVSRAYVQTSTLSDNYDAVSIKRSNTNGASGTFNAAGSVLKLTNASTQTSGTLSDTVIPLEIANEALTSTNFKRTMDLNGITIWTSDGTSPNGSLSGTAGDVCFGADSGKSYYCTGTTSWTAF